MSKSTVEQWFIEYKDYIYKFLVHYVGPDEADDLLQETFLSALRGFYSFKGESNAKTWLCTIARNVSLTHLQKQSKTSRRIESIEDKEMDFISNELSPEHAAELNELKYRISLCIRRLKRNYRDVITLRGVLNLSISETAEVTGWSQTKVRVTYHRAIKALQKEYSVINIGGMDQWAK